MAKTKLSRINSQVRDDGPFVLDGKTGPGPTRKIFADVDAAKAYYYTDNELACFDTHCETVQWALVNDDNGDATKLKFTAEFAAGAIPGKDKDWHDALDALTDELPGHASAEHQDSTKSSTSVAIEDSDDHLF